MSAMMTGSQFGSDRLRHPSATPRNRSADSAGAHYRRPPRQAPRRRTRELLAAPVEQPFAQEARLDPERLAHGIERERAFAALVAQPFLGLGVQALAGTALGVRIVLETAQRVFQEGEHQPLDRPQRAVVAPR